MALSVDTVRERLLELEEIVSRLEKLASTPAGGDYRDEWAGERGLQLGAETLFDVGSRILTSHFGVSAKDYEETLRLLSAEGVIDSALGERLKALGGFRSLVLPEDAARVRESLLRAPRELSNFGRAVRNWLARAISGS